MSVHFKWVVYTPLFKQHWYQCIHGNCNNNFFIDIGIILNEEIISIYFNKCVRLSLIYFNIWDVIVIVDVMLHSRKRYEAVKDINYVCLFRTVVPGANNCTIHKQIADGCINMSLQKGTQLRSGLWIFGSPADLDVRSCGRIRL